MVRSLLDQDQAKIAQSQAAAIPQGQQAPLQAPQLAPQQPGAAQQAGQAALGAGTDALGGAAGTAIGAALTPALGPLGAPIGQALGGQIGGGISSLVGGLFNMGGRVGLNKGGWLSSLFGAPDDSDLKRLQALRKKPGQTPERVNQLGRAVTKPARTETTGLPQFSNPFKGAFTNPNVAARDAAYAAHAASGKPSIWEQIGRNTGGPVGAKKKEDDKNYTATIRKNMGGPISANPHGYNEGGDVQETPMKRVMDEQKLDQQAVAFDKDEMRKQEKHALDMKLKQQQFQQAQQMKKAAASTNKKPKAPLSK